jgi:hypothetical protein
VAPATAQADAALASDFEDDELDDEDELEEDEPDEEEDEPESALFESELDEEVDDSLFFSLGRLSLR